MQREIFNITNLRDQKADLSIYLSIYHTLSITSYHNLFDKSRCAQPYYEPTKDAAAYATISACAKTTGNVLKNMKNIPQSSDEVPESCDEHTKVKDKDGGEEGSISTCTVEINAQIMLLIVNGDFLSHSDFIDLDVFFSTAHYLFFYPTYLLTYSLGYTIKQSSNQASTYLILIPGSDLWKKEGSLTTLSVPTLRDQKANLSIYHILSDKSRCNADTAAEFYASTCFPPPKPGESPAIQIIASPMNHWKRPTQGNVGGVTGTVMMTKTKTKAKKARIMAKDKGQSRGPEGVKGKMFCGGVLRLGLADRSISGQGRRSIGTFLLSFNMYVYRYVYGYVNFLRVFSKMQAVCICLIESVEEIQFMESDKTRSPFQSSQSSWNKGADHSFLNIFPGRFDAKDHPRNISSEELLSWSVAEVWLLEFRSYKEKEDGPFLVRILVDLSSSTTGVSAIPRGAFRARIAAAAELKSPIGWASREISIQTEGSTEFFH
ncbi:hypothetical protein T310_5048 [Rasamsonia emersonii CBS 393.64]|uniref:Uncharacterized protein n=1 Tax=Rasamsonia emersonii (strain ATCC 16479 / CBS 393.64 / IMI 116815) TaxID=1408163 RepID=A0A0F4YTF6_RASE3|nr:hypothetical protein T310_5048 [Rasamsonia emersonii CBS 393.64]KKA20908.1 hypothetical protein T310_5048 [Rasamsonia emersonii CBS 393.64]